MTALLKPIPALRISLVSHRNLEIHHNHHAVISERRSQYIGMDVHQATISAAVMDVHGKLIMECLLETKAATIIEFVRGLQGTLSLTFEEGTSATWLHDHLKPMSVGWWFAICARRLC